MSGKSEMQCSIVARLNYIRMQKLASSKTITSSTKMVKDQSNNIGEENKNICTLCPYHSDEVIFSSISKRFVHLSRCATLQCQFAMFCHF